MRSALPNFFAAVVVATLVVVGQALQTTPSSRRKQTTRVQSSATAAIMEERAKCEVLLVETVQSSKEARACLRRREVEVEWVVIEEEDRLLGLVVDDLVPERPKPTRREDVESFAAYNEVSKREFLEKYQPDKLDPAGNEVGGAAACALVRRVLRLGPEDGFVDLGSAAGRLVLVAALASEAKHCAGLELSTRAHGLALASLDRVSAKVNGRVRFVEADLRDAREVLMEPPATVVYCAVRGALSRPRILDTLLSRLTAEPATQKIRFVCAGFGIDLSGTPYQSRVRLEAAYAIHNPGSSNRKKEPEQQNNALDSALPLYGDDAGPRILLEYSIEAG